MVQGTGSRVQGPGFRVQGFGYRVNGTGYRVQGPWCRVQGAGFRVQGSGYMIQDSGRQGYMAQGGSRPPPCCQEGTGHCVRWEGGVEGAAFGRTGSRVEGLGIRV